VGQLTLVEHCLCPLDVRKSLDENFVHESSYLYSKDGKREHASVRVSCPGGLTPKDEFYLWGLLSLTLSQPQPVPNLIATRHYCLRQLGKIDSRRRGGRQYRQLAESLERLSLVAYRNDGFYDAVRGEHRRVSFGFLSYSLPRDLESSRAWHITWNPIFFEFCLAARSMLVFDFTVYSALDPASRRLFLFLHKLFWRYRRTPLIAIRDLAVHVLGFSESLTPAECKARIHRTANRLREAKVISGNRSACFQKVGKGDYTVRFTKGTYFERRMRPPILANEVESPLADPLRSIGFGPDEVSRIVHQFRGHLIQQWSDVTLAALEQKGPSFFKRSPQAYFMHNIQKAALGTRTPPDWWLDLRKNESRVRAEYGGQNAKARIDGTPTTVGDVLNTLIDDGAVPVAQARVINS
jgi:hypothetical protein